jgi:hypothetical protein
VTHGRRQLLIKWKGQGKATASWVDTDEFQSLYPSFELMDEHILQGERDVMWGKVYSRCGKAGCAHDQNVASTAATDTAQE